MTALADTRFRIEVEGLVVDREARVVSLDGEPVELRRREFDFLSLLAANPRRVVPHREMSEALYGVDLSRTSRSVDAHACRVRRQLKGRFVTSVRGVGYRLLVEVRA